MKTTIIGFPRIGFKRELKFAIEKYFKGELNESDLRKTAEEIQTEQFKLLKSKNVDLIPINDFSYYDNMLDMAFLLGAIEQKYLETDLSKIQKYFAVARGLQNEKYDLKAYEMKKWFDTNYHYIVPKLSDEVKFELDLEFLKEKISIVKKSLSQFRLELIGPFTFIKLARTKNENSFQYLDKITENYLRIIEFLKTEDIPFISFEEPVLSTDLEKTDIQIFCEIYRLLLSRKGNMKAILQTYFGDIRDIYKEIMNLNFEAVGLDFVAGKKNIELIQRYGFDKNKILMAGVVNGRNIWRTNYEEVLNILSSLPAKDLYISTSCSLLYVPYTVADEERIPEEIKEKLSFAVEKLAEIEEIKILLQMKEPEKSDIFQKNKKIFQNKVPIHPELKNIKEEDFRRILSRSERKKLQRENLSLPPLPTTTIGSFPQTEELRKKRKLYREGKITLNEYESFIKEKIKEVIKLQEEIGIDVIVHGEFERNDMVEYFAEFLSGIITTENGWVQSYGTRATKPPIIYDNIKRKEPMTVKWISFAQSFTTKPVKAILTGPATIINWSFCREDVEIKDVAYQIALALREEIEELQSKNIKVIQVDEAAFREKFPLRKSELKSYLEWVISAFKLATAKIKPEIQLHTHMCYSEFSDTIEFIEQMDADVLTVEAAKSDLSILAAIKDYAKEREIGPGVYDIHSPRIPSTTELKSIIKEMLKYIPYENLWINPDCGLKTRKFEEVTPSLKNMVEAARSFR
ncbi:MAG: 5-methyltetrahydropteroyltriglutamate--homocysteine S-methyltransferase [Brevinematia bacterium]